MVTEKTKLSELAKSVPLRYHKYLQLFKEKWTNQLPPYRTFDHAINHVEGDVSLWYPMDKHSSHELEVIHKYLDYMLRTGKIASSKSLARATILFVRKPYGCRLRLYFYYRCLTSVTLKNRYLLPLMDKLKDRIIGARIFTKIDLKSSYNLVRIKKGDELKTVFRIWFDH